VVIFKRSYLKIYDELILMSAGKQLLLTSITSFYEKNPHYKKQLDVIVQGDFSISLRVIDWFITHYAKEHNVFYWIDKDHIVSTPKEYLPSLKKFNVYLEYRAQLKSYTKLFFDPFRRHERISFIIQNNPLQVIETTIGQLNFFRWIFQNHILDYIKLNQEKIETEMTKFQSIKKEPCTKKRTITNNTITETKCFLRFD
jgi:hypothetical protein